MKYEDRPFTVQMPNTVNFCFDFRMSILLWIPATYVMFFPGLFGHMVTQRKKYYEAQAKERAAEALTVPAKFRQFRTIEGLKKFTNNG